MYTVYKVVSRCGDYMMSFEAASPAYRFYIKGLNHSNKPCFFFTSPATAITYVREIAKHDLGRAENATLWMCDAKSIHPAPLKIPPPQCSELFDPFWRAYYRSRSKDTTLYEAFEGLVKPPLGTVLAFEFTLMRELPLVIPPF